MELNTVGQIIRILSYFMVMIFYILLAAHAFYRNSKWESTSSAFTAMFLILLFQISLYQKNEMIAFVLTPLLVGWAIFGISFLIKVVIDSRKK